MASSGRSIADRRPPQAYFVVSAIFHYLGPAFAVLLFARVDVLGVAWLRIAAAAAISPLWRRPWRAFAARTPGAPPAGGLAAVLAAMNCTFYTGHRPAAAQHGLGDRVPAGHRPRGDRARTPRNAAALAMAVAGVYLLTDVQLAASRSASSSPSPTPLLFALYIVLAHRVAKRRCDPVASTGSPPRC